MAELRVSRHAKTKKEKDYLAIKDRYTPIPEYRKSVLELRKIYSGMDLDKFAEMYQSKYGLRKASVIKIIEQEEQKHVGLSDRK